MRYYFTRVRTAIINKPTENFLVAQWLGLCTSTAGGRGLIPGRRTKVLPALGQLSPVTQLDSVHRDERSDISTKTLCAATKTQCSLINFKR